VEVSREVEVPPFKSVTVTDTIKIVENYLINFEETGKFYGQGLSGNEVKNILGSINSIDREIIEI